ncbi:MAG: alpha-galactosidase, partial [Clostridia bacterium]|nr:alpha-galactosidase [Clostridia bacterium]
MPVNYDSEKKIFKLDTAGSSYVFQVFDENYLVHLYYGAPIPDNNLSSMYYHGGFASFSPSNAKVKTEGFSPDMCPMEYSTQGAGDFRISALSVLNCDGNNVTDIRYTGHKIYMGKPEIVGLPSLYLNDINEAQTLEVYTEDIVTGVKVTLVYTVFEKYSAITRNVIIEN